jgi:membrane associated rhomboid family serine protease
MKTFVMHIKKLPFLTFLLFVLLIASFYIGNQHDERQWISIEKHYQSQLLEIEVPIYLDYLEREFKVAGLGSLNHIDELKLARDNGSFLPIIEAIITDHNFTHYIEQKGHLFLSNETLAIWKKERDTLEPFFQATSAQQLALNPRNFQPRQIITHLVTHPYNLSFALILVSLVVIVYWFESTLGVFRLCYYLLISALISSLIYLLFSSNNTPVLEGPLSATYGLVSALLVYSFQRGKITKASILQSKFILVISGLSVLCLSAYTFMAIFSHSAKFIYLLSTIAFPSLACGLFMLFGLRIAENGKPPGKEKTASNSSLDWEYRAELAKALDFLSRFEFNSARQLLNSLSKRYPDSQAILEQRYHLAKLQPIDSLYWKLAKELIELCVQNQDYDRLIRLFRDIQKSAASKKRAQEQLDPEHYHKIMTLFLSSGDLPKAEQAFHFLELGGDKHIIQDACLVLIEEFKIRKTTSKQQQYEMLLERLKA